MGERFARCIQEPERQDQAMLLRRFSDPVLGSPIALLHVPLLRPCHAGAKRRSPATIWVGEHSGQCTS